MEEKEKNTTYVKGIIGAVIGGLIATIPWVLVYIYGNLMLSLLAVLIGVGEFYGYKIFKGKIDNKLPLIIMVIAVVIITIVTLIVIPMIRAQQLNISFINLYQYNNFAKGIIKDYLISLVFTILGASVVTANVKKQLLNSRNPEDMKLDLANNEEKEKMKKDAISVIKPIFEKYGCTNQENTMTKEEVIAELEEENTKIYFNYLKGYKIIKKYKGKYYYDAECENYVKSKPDYTKIFTITAVVIVIIAAIVTVFGFFYNETETIGNDDVSFKKDIDWLALEEYTEDYGWIYYKYISNTDSQNLTSADEFDYTDYPATIQIAYQNDLGEDAYESIEQLQESIETYIEEMSDVSQYNTYIEKTSKNYDVLKVKTVYEEAPAEIDYTYYIYDNNRIAYIIGSTFNEDDDSELLEEIELISNNFEWK